MIYRIFNPTPALADIIEHYWYSKAELSGSPHQYYPTPLLQGLTFNFHKQEERHAYDNKTFNLHKQVHLFGQPTCPRTITRHEKGMHMLGVKFKPLGIAKLTGINMEHTVNGIIAADDLWGIELESLWDEMQSASLIEKSIAALELFLLKKHAKVKQHHRVNNVYNTLTVINNMRGTMGIAALQNLTNTTRKTLERSFLHHLGLSPKFYSQIVRFNTAKSILDNPSTMYLSDLGFQLGYYDRSHFTADFKRFSGLTPSEYVKKKHEEHHLISFCPFFPKRHLIPALA